MVYGISRKLIFFILIFSNLSTALATEKIQPHIYSFNCETTAEKIDLIFFTCADGNTGIAKIKWKSWTSKGAEGTGLYYQNTCNPSCADGKFKYVSVSVKLSRPLFLHGNFYLTQLDYRQTKEPYTLSGSLDLYSLYKDMKSVSSN